MSDHNTTPSPPRAPRGLTPGARAAWRDVLAQRPDLDGAELAQLREACRLIASADRLEETVGDDVVVSGSREQLTVHPALTEARLSRAAASTVLTRLAPPAHRAASASHKAQRASRSRWDRHKASGHRSAPSAPSGATITDLAVRMAR